MANVSVESGNQSETTLRLNPNSPHRVILKLANVCLQVTINPPVATVTTINDLGGSISHVHSLTDEIDVHSALRRHVSKLAPKRA